jgi:hypothetical protein
MARINVGRLAHLRGAEVERQVALWVRHQDLISEDAAVTIASWFQSPSHRDAPFASLASTGKCDAEELVDVCQGEMEAGHYDRGAIEALKALQAWAARFR